MNEKRATYGKGALGAFLGALAGFAAWCIFAYFVGGNLQPVTYKNHRSHETRGNIVLRILVE